MEGVHDEAWLQKLLLDYELTLGYVNRKRDADRISTDLSSGAARSSARRCGCNASSVAAATRARRWLKSRTH